MELQETIYAFTRIKFNRIEPKTKKKETNLIMKETMSSDFDLHAAWVPMIMNYSKRNNIIINERCSTEGNRQSKQTTIKK